MSVEFLLQAVLALLGIALAVFCAVLARRLRRLNDLETGLGAAIAVMAAEVGRLEAAMDGARTEATTATQALAAEIERAKGERAFWTLQQQFSSDVRPARRLRRRRTGALSDA